MQQSNFIFGAIFIAFIVFITTRGSLSNYTKVLFGNAEIENSSAQVPNNPASTFGGFLFGATPAPDIFGGFLKRFIK